MALTPKTTRVTVYVDGEVLHEHHFPIFLLPFMRWLCRMLGATMHTPWYS
jgi:hypothetical protein